jgi:hypothetical protein
VARGDLFAAAAHYRATLVVHHHDPQSFETLAARLLMGGLLREWNRLTRAEAYLRRTLETAAHAQQDHYLHTGYLQLALVVWARRPQDEEISKLFDTSFRLAQLLGDVHGLRFGRALQARIALQQKNSVFAQTWRKTCGLGVTDEVSYFREVEFLTLCRCLIADGPEGAARAMEILRRLTTLAVQQKREHSLIEIGVVQALAHQVCAQGGDALEMRQAMSALGHSLELARQAGNVRIFLDEGPALVELLKWYAREMEPRPELKEYLDRVMLQANPESNLVEKLKIPLPFVNGRRTPEALDMLIQRVVDGEIKRGIYLNVEELNGYKR